MTFEREQTKKNLQAKPRTPTKPDGKKNSSVKDTHDKLKKIANQKFGNDDRFKPKFIELGLKL